MTTPYDTLRRETLRGRDLEREVLARATARLTAADAEQPGALERALEDNRRIWMTLAADLAQPGNVCPDELKAGLISLAGFVERQTGRLLRGEGEVAPLIEINRNVLIGLAGPSACVAA